MRSSTPRERSHSGDEPKREHGEQWAQAARKSEKGASAGALSGAIVFGSRACGDHRPDSDCELCLIGAPARGVVPCAAERGSQSRLARPDEVDENSARGLRRLRQELDDEWPTTKRIRCDRTA